jgi:hypothetical protein
MVIVRQSYDYPIMSIWLSYDNLTINLQLYVAEMILWLSYDLLTIILLSSYNFLHL